ncbi:hypothetical protein N324_05181, partial [Chlamydotis macqueenii]
LSNFHPKITDPKKPRAPQSAALCCNESVQPLISGHSSKGTSKNMQFSSNYNQCRTLRRN